MYFSDNIEELQVYFKKSKIVSLILISLAYGDLTSTYEASIRDWLKFRSVNLRILEKYYRNVPWVLHKCLNIELIKICNIVSWKGLRHGLHKCQSHERVTHVLGCECIVY